MKHIDLAVQYGIATYEAERWQLRAEALLAQLKALAKEDAVCANQPAPPDVTTEPVDLIPATQDKDAEPPHARPVRRRTGATNRTQTAEIYRNRLTKGLYSRVAKQLGLAANGRSHVRRVAHGERTSAPIQAALAAEFARIDREVKRFEQKRASIRRDQISGGRAA